MQRRCNWLLRCLKHAPGSMPCARSFNNDSCPSRRLDSRQSAPAVRASRHELSRGRCRCLSKSYVSDAACEEVAAGDVACGVATENNRGAERTLEFVEHSWFEDRGLQPVGCESELAVLDGKAVSGLEFGAGVFADVLREIFRGSLKRLIPFKKLRRSVFEIHREAHTRVWLAVEGDFRTCRGHEVSCVARFKERAECSHAFLRRGNFKDGVRFQAAIPAGERQGVNARSGGGRGFRRELAGKVKVRDLIRQAAGIAGANIAQRDDGKSLLRESQKFGAITEKSSAVFNDRQTAVGADDQTERVFDVFSVVENA